MPQGAMVDNMSYDDWKADDSNTEYGLKNHPDESLIDRGVGTMSLRSEQCRELAKVALGQCPSWTEDASPVHDRQLEDLTGLLETTIDGFLDAERLPQSDKMTWGAEELAQ